MTDKLKAHQQELAASVTKKTWVEPTVQIISVQSGIRTLISEASAVTSTKAQWAS